jgi:hypothetical protein
MSGGCPKFTSSSAGWVVDLWIILGFLLCVLIGLSLYYGWDYFNPPSIRPVMTDMIKSECLLPPKIRK